jgi:asparagine synthase (glutamine-hydrolysing)
MTITPTKQTIKRYWHPKKIRKEKLPNRQAYIDRLRELLEDAIKVRMRTAYPVASHLSGGLDSSPIAVLVAREMKKRDPNYKLPAFAWVHPPSSDDDITKHHEWHYPTIIAQQEDIDFSFTTLDSDEMYDIVQLTDIYTHTGNSFAYESKIRPALQQNNIRTMFSGWGGDEFITNHSYAFYCESFIKGRWKILHQRATKRLQNLHKHPPTLKNYLKLYYKKIFVPLMPRWLYCYLPKINCKPLDTSLYTEHIKQYALKIYQNKNFIFSRETSCLCSSDLDRAWQNAHIQSRLDIWSQESRPYRFEYTYPLLDKRLVEFSYVMPCKYMIANGFDRVIYREAISHLLPDEILYGIHKNEPIRWNSIGEITQEVLEDIQYKSNQDYILTAKLKEHKETEFHYLSLLTQSKK